MENNCKTNFYSQKQFMYPPFLCRIYTDVFYTDDDLIKLETRCNNKIHIRLVVSIIAYISNGSDLDVGEYYSQSGMRGVNYYFVNQAVLFFKKISAAIYHVSMGRDCVNRYSDSLRAGRSGDRIAGGGGDFPSPAGRPCCKLSLLYNG
jgi:hypothetical protein